MAIPVARHRIPSGLHSLPISSLYTPSSVPPRRFLISAFPPSAPLPGASRSGIRLYSSNPLPSKSNLIQLNTVRIRNQLLSACTTNHPSPSRIALASVRSFNSSPPRHKNHHFDTLKLVERLQKEGFTEEQAVAMMNVLSDVIEESVQNLTRTMVSQAEQEKITYTQKVDFAQLRADLQTHHSAEYQATRAEYERLSSEIAKLNSRLREEIIRAQNSVKLDLNLEKGRIREEASVHELKIKETDTRIETEVGMIRGTLESVKFSTLQWLIGVCTGTAALILGVWRLLA